MQHKNVIYQIVNLINQKRYIGSTVNFKHRTQYQHLTELRKNIHSNKHLQRAYNKYGEENFIFEIIDQVRHPAELKWREMYWFSKYDFDTELYNVAEDAFAPTRGRQLSEEHKAKLSKVTKGKNNPFYGKHHTEETKQILSEANSGENAYWYGKKFSKKHCEKISFAQRGEKNWNYGGTLSQETKDKISKAVSGENNPFYGKSHTEESRELMSKNNARPMLGKKLLQEQIDILVEARSKPVAQLNKDTNEIIAVFASASDASKVTGIQRAHISAVCNKTPHIVDGKTYIRKTAGNFKWVLC